MDSNPYDVKTNSVIKSTVVVDALTARFPYVDILDWKNGMRFIVPPLSDPFYSEKLPLCPYQSAEGKYAFVDQKTFQWKMFRFEEIEYRKGPQGQDQVYIVFSCEGNKYEHPAMVSPTVFRDPKRGYVVPVLTYLEEVDACKEELTGKTLFVLDRGWRKDKPGGGSTKVAKGKKYVPVKVVNIGVGDSAGPVKIIFQENNSTDEYFILVQFSGINALPQGYIQKFSKTFSLADPHQDFVSITDENWSKIQAGDVQVGMTTQECELAWAKPRKINDFVFQDTDYEMWDFNTELLLFKDGILDVIKTGTDRFGIRLKG